MHKASMRESETFEQTVHRQEQNRMCMASMRESAAPRVWHFSAFHYLGLLKGYHCKNKVVILAKYLVTTVA